MTPELSAEQIIEVSKTNIIHPFRVAIGSPPSSATIFVRGKGTKLWDIFPAFVLAAMTTVVTSAAAGEAGAMAEKATSPCSPVGTPVPLTPNWSLEQLRAMTNRDVIELWKTLPAATAATLEELSGLFAGVVPDFGDKALEMSARLFNSEKGYWLGKAFRRTGPDQGEGYNQLRAAGGKIIRSRPFSTEIGTSLIDGKPVLKIYYGAYDARVPNALDEVRKLDDSIYVALSSHVVADDGTRSWKSMFLVGPVNEWVGGAPGEPVPRFERPTK